MMLRRLLRKIRAEGLEPVASAMPLSAVRKLTTSLTIDRAVSVCLHRVLPEPRPFMLSPGLAHRPDEIDAFLEIFRDCPKRLTLTFDDGYLDALTYILDRAPLHPDVQWKYMLCPAKTVGRFGFAWDRWIVDGNIRNEDTFMEDWKKEFSMDSEHQVREQPVGDMPDYLLATVDECRLISELPNVELGNHSNHHFPLAWLSEADLNQELESSRSIFMEHFGAPQHFAFPFGTPTFVSRRCIRRASETHGTKVWTVDIRPNRDEHRGYEYTWSRFPWDSSKFSPKAFALYIALKCSRDRATEPNLTNQILRESL